MKPKNVFKDLWNNDTKQRTPNSQMNSIVGAKARERTSQGVNYYTDKYGINLRTDRMRHENNQVKRNDFRTVLNYS